MNPIKNKRNCINEICDDDIYCLFFHSTGEANVPLQERIYNSEGKVRCPYE